MVKLSKCRVFRMMCSHGQVSFFGKLSQRGSLYGGSTNVGSRDRRSIVLSGDTFVRLRVTSVGGQRREESSTLIRIRYVTFSRILFTVVAGSR